MKLCPAVLGLLVTFLGVGEAIPTWPASIDELEDVMFLNTGYKNRGFTAHITPCSFSEFGAGRQTAAEWLRIGFHDMATANAGFAPHGGIDGSIAFELNSGENIGAGFTTTLTTYSGIFNTRLPLSDVIALGVYASVRGCGGPVVPMRGGRVDKYQSGPIGVPQPQNGQGVFISQFSRMGFSVTQMIQMTACGHTLGGVHAGDFPTIVVPGTAPDDFQLFDNTLTFDNGIATRYVNGPNTDPLSVGPAAAPSNGRDSDNAVFTADGNVTIKAMTDVATFNSMCSNILQQMIETVDPTIVTLTDIIQPYEVKPSGLLLELSSTGAQLTFTGDIRVRTTTRSAAQIASVILTYTDRSGATGTITTTVSGTAAGFDENFAFYGFSKSLSATTSITSFTVAITLTAAAGGTTTTYNNNGAGFPVQDSVIVQMPQSCLASGSLTVVAAVRNTVTGNVTLDVTQKIPRTLPRGIVVPALTTTEYLMTQGSTLGQYTIYSGAMTLTNTTGIGSKFGVTSGSFTDDFYDATALSATCLPVGSSPTVSSTSSTSSTSATPTPSLAHKQTVGAYTFQGCYTEANGGRALTGASFYDYPAMTIEECANNCASYTYFGVEYGGECYCGNTLASTSTQALLSDCNFICPGNKYEYCGAGSRLELYELTSALTSVSTTKSTTSSSSTKSSTAKPTSTTSSSSITTSSTSSSVASTTTPSTPTVSTLGIKPTVGAYSYIGCYTEAASGRALSAASFYDYPAMTLEECAVDCAAYQYFGVEYGGECYCGNSIDSTAVLAPVQSDCNFVCPGNKYEYCGAGNRLEMYQKGAVVSSSKSSTSSSTTHGPVSTSTTSSSKSSSSSTSSTSKSSTFSTSTTKASTSTTSSAPSNSQTALGIKSVVGNYKYYGCQTEATNMRALSSASFYDYPAMTLEECAADCKGYTYFGVEYGGECYCGNSFNTGSVPAADSDCSFVCPGNSFEYCGAGNRLSAYVLA